MPERGPMSVTPGSRLLWRPYRCTQLYFHESKKARALSTGDNEKVEKKNLKTLANFPELHRGLHFLKVTHSVWLSQEIQGYNTPCLSVVSLSVVSVTHSQPQT